VRDQPAENLPPMPRVTGDLPGTGGRLRVETDDFQVTEIPRYEPSGSGPHAYLWVEKRGLATHEMVHRLAKALGRSWRDFGTAGLKDARAVTRQWVSIEHVDPAAVANLSGDGWRVLAATRHRNKLKTGHLQGNAFHIVVREVGPEALERARAVLERLGQCGVPNIYGPQRFGMRCDSHLIGRALLTRDWREVCDQLLGRPAESDPPATQRFRSLYDQGQHREAREVLPRGNRNQAAVLETLLRTKGDHGRAARALPKQMRRFFISAWQSALFNRVVARRMPDLGRLIKGDLAWLHDRGAVFEVEDVGAEQGRADRFEISPSGPMFGARMKWPTGRPGEIEAEVLAASGLEAEVFGGGGSSGARGGRRPLRVPLVGAAVERAAEGIRVLFSLPRGSYATVVMDEITKTDNSETGVAGRRGDG